MRWLVMAILQGRHNDAMRLVLASRSPARLATLRSAGITPIVRVSDTDEEAVLRALHTEGNPTPAEQVNALASEKRQAVVSSLLSTSTPIDEDGAHNLLVLGCDSMLEIGGQMLGKPHEPDIARQRIRQMRSHSATLWTGHSLSRLSFDPTKERYTLLSSLTQAASTLVHFGDMSDEEIDAYVDSGEPLKVAGSFTIDGLGGPFIAGIEGDPHSVVGVSLPLLRSLARSLGVFWPKLWDHRRGR